jgi:hypothetical protein
MDEQLMCVLRRPTGLAALFSRRRQKFVHPRPVLDDPAPPLAEVDPYLDEVRPFGDRDPGRCNVWTEVIASWDYLGRVSVFDARTLFHALYVLTHTLPEGEADVPPLRIEPDPPARQPTAAHPRAYRGTKHQPPKVRRGAPVDLRPHLCVAGNVNKLLRYLALWLPDALPLLQRADLSPEHFPCLVDTDGRVADPYLQYCHAAPDQSVHALPAKFRTHLLFWLRGQPWNAVRDALALYWGLGLATDGPLLRCLSRFLAALPVPSVLEWGRVLLQQPASRRVALAELLVETHVQGWSPSGRLAEIIHEVDRLSSDAVYRHRMFTLLRSLRLGNELEYLHDGFGLAQRYQPEFEFRDVGRCDFFPRDAIEEFIEYVTASTGPQDRWRPRYALSLWEACAELQDFGSFLETRPWRGLAPDAAYEAIHLFREVASHDIGANVRQAKWRKLRQAAPRLFGLLRGIEASYQRKAVAYLRDLTWFWDEPDALAQNLERYRLLLPRLCGRPFARQAIPGPLTRLTLLSPPEWAELTGADDN